MTSLAKKKIKLLLLEDNKSDVMMIRRHLARAQMYDFEIVDTDHVKSALTILTNPRDNKPFDLIFLDMNVCDSIGHATVLDVYAEFPNIPIIVLSGHEDIRVAYETLECGAHAFVVKKSPVDFYPSANPTEAEKARASKAITDELERMAMQILCRDKFATTLSDLTEAAILAAGGVQADPANIQLLLAYIDKLDESLTRMREYLHKNHPIAWDALKSVFTQDLDPIIMKLRSNTSIKPAPDTANNNAMTAVVELTTTTKSEEEIPATTLQEAERRLLDALNIDPRVLFEDEGSV